MPRSLKKGPFVDLSLSKKVDKAIANNDKKTNQNLVEKIHDNTINGWLNNFCS